MNRPCSVCIDGNHAHDGNVLAGISTIAYYKDKVSNLANKWILAFDEHYGVGYPFCVSRQIENKDPRFIEILNIRAGARILCRFKLRDLSPVGRILVAMYEFIGDALVEDEDSRFLQQTRISHFSKRMVQMWHDWRLALTSLVPAMSSTFREVLNPCSRCIEWASLACLLGKWHIVLCKLLILVYIHEFVPLRKTRQKPYSFLTVHLSFSSLFLI